MLRTDFCLPQARTHEYSIRICDFVDHHVEARQPRIAEPAFKHILPDIVALQRQLIGTDVEAIGINENQTVDHRILGKQAADHLLRLANEGQEHILYQFTPGRRMTRGAKQENRVDPVSDDAIVRYALDPAAREFAAKTIDALTYIDEHLEPHPTFNEKRQYLQHHGALLRAQRRANQEMMRYVRLLPESEGYNEQRKVSSLARSHAQAMLEQHTKYVRQIGAARSADLIAGTVTSTTKNALIAITLARLQVLKPRVLKAFELKVDNALVVRDMQWERAQRASLAEDGHNNEDIDMLINAAKRYRAVGLENLQLTESINSDLSELGVLIERETGKSEAAIIAELKAHSVQFDQSLKTIARQIGGSVSEAAEFIAKTNRETADGINENLRAAINQARESAREQNKLLADVYGAVNKKSKQGGRIGEEMSKIASRIGSHIGCSVITSMGKFAAASCGIPFF